MNLEIWIGAALFTALVLYALTGGADFGGGVWELLAWGPRAQNQRKIIRGALAPIWEANHVWLILAVVLLFMAFPAAFADVAVALHVPLVAMLFGVVLRGAAFVFLSQASPGTPERRWSRVFSAASLVTPLFLGIVVGAVAGGSLGRPAEMSRLEDFISSWWRPFPLTMGLFALALFAFLAAVYLTLETKDEDLQDDFRLRALLSGLAVGGLAWAALLLAREEAPLIYKGLMGKRWSFALQAATGATALGVFRALVKRRFHGARFLAVLQVTLVLAGWAYSQYPYLIVPELTLSGAAAPASVLRPLAAVLLASALLILPSFWYLFSVFKKEQLKMRP
jgi:cytochrome bd ubiquinol oxidase subunit II